MAATFPAMRTRITQLLKCRYPLILPGMSWISQAELVAAVCNAGGMGILASGPLTAEQTRAEITKIRQLTNQPFGVGVTLLMPGATDNARVALEEQVPCINTSLGKADWIAKGLEEYQGTLLCTVTNRLHAQVAIQESGAHALLVTGHEAAAHGGDVTSLCLIPTMAQEFPHIPLIAAGGFATGHGLAAALCLGADAVAMGSRFAVTKESPLAQTTKEAIIQHQANESATIYGRNFDGIPARVLKTPTSIQLMKHRPWLPTIVYRAIQAAYSLGLPVWKVLVGLLIGTQWDKLFVVAQFGAATQALTQATIHGNLKDGVQFIGQAQGLIHDIPTVHDLVQTIVKEAHDVSIHQAQTVFQTEDEDMTNNMDNHRHHGHVNEQ